MAINNSINAGYTTGTWTPSVNFTSVPATLITYSSQTGAYNVLGNLCFFTFTIGILAYTQGPASGHLIIQTFPFTFDASAGSMVFPMVFGSINNDSSGGAQPSTISGIFQSGDNYCRIIQSYNDQLAIVMDPNNMRSNSTIVGSGFYRFS